MRWALLWAELTTGDRLRCATHVPLERNATVAISIRPETVRVTIDKTEAATGENANRLSDRVQNVAFLGDSCRVDVLVGETMFLAKAAADFAAPAETEVDLVFAASDTLAIPKS